MSWLYAKLFWLMHFFCHQQSERSFHWDGVQWFLCARCSGALVGAILVIPFSLSQQRRKTKRLAQPLALTALMLPLIVDGFGGFSNSFSLAVGNEIRFATGVAFSLGATKLFADAYPLLDKLSRRCEGTTLAIPPAE